MQIDIFNNNRNQIILKKEEWIKLKSKLKKIVNKEIGKISKLQENENFFYVIAILKEGSDSIKLAKVKWKKPSFEKWWKGERLNHNSSISEYNFDYTLPIIRVKSCANDIWKETFNAASERFGHTAIWTGTEMIIWGGYDGNSLNSGGIYSVGCILVRIF